MKLKIENIGKIKQADIDLSSITVITGINGTGKSTIARSLYATFSSFYNIYNEIEEERKKSIKKLSNAAFDMGNIDGIYKRDDRRAFINSILENMYDINAIYKIAEEWLIDKDDRNSFLEKYESRILMEDVKILYGIIQERFDDEFNRQINNIYNKDQEGRIWLKIKENEIQLKFKNQQMIGSPNKISLDKEAIYVDNFKDIENIDFFKALFSIDENMLYSRRESHGMSLYSKILSSEKTLVVENLVKTEEIDKIFDEVFKDTFIDTNVYKGDYDKTENIDLRNIADGLKNFVVMRYLIEKESIIDRGVLILDEPEIHLHPEWQLKFAELIVLINKYFNTHILINTHSPYFLNAIEVYSKKHGINNEKYYLAELDGNTYDVTDDLEKAYLKLARPLQILEDLENEYY